MKLVLDGCGMFEDHLRSPRVTIEVTAFGLGYNGEILSR